MKVTINGEPRELTRIEPTVAELLGELGLAGRPVAVEVNRQLVFKRNHGTTRVREGDRIEVVTMVGGG